MPRNNLRQKKKSPLESIISKVHSDFGALVGKSYFPRFVQPSMTTQLLVSKKEHASSESDGET